MVGQELRLLAQSEPRDMPEFLFGSQRQTSASVTLEQKMKVFDQIMIHMLTGYQKLKQKYDALAREKAPDAETMREMELKYTLPDLDTMGRVWSENTKVKTSSGEQEEAKARGPSQPSPNMSPESYVDPEISTDCINEIETDEDDEIDDCEVNAEASEETS